MEVAFSKPLLVRRRNQNGLLSATLELNGANTRPSECVIEVGEKGNAYAAPTCRLAHVCGISIILGMADSHGGKCFRHIEIAVAGGSQYNGYSHTIDDNIFQFTVIYLNILMRHIYQKIRVEVACPIVVCNIACNVQGGVVIRHIYRKLPLILCNRKEY